jgi:uncharacterized protein
MEKYPMHYKSADALTDLPYFKRNAKGRPVLALDDAPPIIDCHIHLGFHFLFSRPNDLYRRTRRVRHSFREDSLSVDLTLYSGLNLKAERRSGTFSDHAHTVFTRHGSNDTYTIPNVLEEMDRMGIARSIVLAIDLPIASRNSQYQLEHIAHHPRLIPFCAVNALSPRWEAAMDECVEMGARGLKIHPYAQMLPPNHPRIMRLLRRWSRTGLPVLFHTAHNGLEPTFLSHLAEMEHYEEPLKKFPETLFIFGHAGMLFYEQACAMAKAHGNTYLEIGGQPPQNIRHIVELIGPDHVLFGSDWPFYPFILPLAKTLIATDGMPDVRRKILAENAGHLFEAMGLGASGRALAGVQG